MYVGHTESTDGADGDELFILTVASTQNTCQSGS